MSLKLGFREHERAQAETEIQKIPSKHKEKTYCLSGQTREVGGAEEGGSVSDSQIQNENYIRNHICNCIYTPGNSSIIMQYLFDY